MKKELLILILFVTISSFIKAQSTDEYFSAEEILKHKIKSITVSNCINQRNISKILYNTKGNKIHGIEYDAEREAYFNEYDSCGNLLKITCPNGDAALKFSNNYDKKDRLIKSVCIHVDGPSEFRKMILWFEYDDKNQIIKQRKKEFSINSSHKEKSENEYKYGDLVKVSPTGIYSYKPDPAGAKYDSNGLMIQSGDWCYKYEFY